MRRIFLIFITVAAVVGILSPTTALTAAASPDLSGFNPDFSAAIPFLPEGQSATVGGVTVTATTNTGVQGDGSNTYLHQSNSRIRTVLTFDEPIPGFKAQVRLHNDCLTTAGAPPDCFEDYHFVGLNDSGDVVFDTSIRNSDTTMSFVPGEGAGDLSGLIATLEIDYSHDPAADFLRGSYLDLWLTDTYLEPATQTVSGTTGEAIKSTSIFDATGFAGAITYSITDGKLPRGLRLNPKTGVISGTPLGTSDVTVIITATGATTGVAAATVTFSISDPATTDTTDGSDSTRNPDELANSGANLGLLLFAVAALLLGVSLTTATSRRRKTI